MNADVRASDAAPRVAWICETCGVQVAPQAAAPSTCAICSDERQYVGWSGQRWTTPEALRERHRIDFLDEQGVTTMVAAPGFGIGQRAFLVPDGDRFVMWECLGMVTREAVERIEAMGGVSAIAISHPHFYAAMADWSEALGNVPIHLHAADRAWVQRPSPAIRFWEGDRLDLSGDLALVHLGGHFDGSAGLHWKHGPRGGILFPGDAVQVVMDRRSATFMYSYPNAIPLGPGALLALRERVAALDYRDLYGFRRGLQIIGDADACVDASFDRYLHAIAA